MDSLTELESSILYRLSKIYPAIEKHIPILKVLNRRTTGVGMYVDFYYTINNIPSLHFSKSEICISTNEDIVVEGLEYGIGYEVAITGNRLIYIEFVTYGEEWDGDFKNYIFPDCIS